MAVEPGPVQQSVEYWVTIDSWGRREHSVTEPGDFKHTVDVIASRPLFTCSIHQVIRAKIDTFPLLVLVKIGIMQQSKKGAFSETTISYSLLLRKGGKIRVNWESRTF